MRKRLTLRIKLIAAFLIVSLLPLGLVTFIALHHAGRALSEEAVAKFTAVQETKRHHIEDYFKGVRTSMQIIKDDPFLHQCLNAFASAFADAGNTVDDEGWRTIVDFKEPRIKDIVADNGFHDLFLISPEGDIVYTASKEADLGMNIPRSELAQSTLGRAFAAMTQAGADEIAVGDFAAYSPSNGAQAAFMMARMIDITGHMIGYAAIQLPADQINAIVQQRSGMGETGESYLVGQLDGQSSLRSDRVVKAGRIGDATTDAYSAMALKGQSGSAIQTGDAGDKAFVRYDPVDIRGLNWALITTAAADEVFAAVDSLRAVMLVVILVVAAVVVGLAVWVAGMIVKPIKGTVTMLKDIAEGEGDLTKRLTVKSQDETGEMATWFNTFMDKLQAIIRQIADDAATLNEASSTLSVVAGAMTEGVGNMSRRSEEVNGASDAMSTNMSSVAAASEQAATNVNMVASATEEMTATVNEIARNSEKARTITESAVTKAGDASSKVDELGCAAKEISKVTEVITEISEQTNLLALNATIEAARAGEAGKGFAVVANEIKELARQTAAATQEIKNRIDGIQGSTSDTVTQIEAISGVINEVNDIVATIATAVEEQAATSQEIANNVAQASRGIQDVNQNVNESSTVAGTISGEITEINASIHAIADSSGQVNQNAERLAVLSDNLKALVGRFKV